MSRWFRVHDDLVDDPKVQLLSGEMVKSLLNLWCLASQNDGLLPSMKEMAFKLRMKPQQVAAIIAELSSAELIDHEGGEYRPHNWEKRQYKSDTDKTAAERSKRYRAKHRDGNGPVTRDAGRDGHGDRHAPPSVSVSVSVSDSVSNEEETSFDAFWIVWPNKVGKPAALKAYRSAIKRGVSHVDIVEGVLGYVSAKPPDRPWLNPATFLNQNRWEDRPAPVLPIAKPLTEFQRKQQETNDVRAQLRNLGSGSRGGGALDRLLPDYHRERSEGLRSGAGQTVLELPGASNRGGH